jgi:hypothetical protein
MFSCFRILKLVLGKSFEDKVRESGIILPEFHPKISSAIPAPTVANPHLIHLRSFSTILCLHPSAGVTHEAYLRIFLFSNAKTRV